MISILNIITATPVASDVVEKTIKGITEGQAVKCSAGGNGNGDAVYRYTYGKLSWYPNPNIATSWDANWGNFIQVDCTQYPVSTAMITAPHEGQAVKCSSGGNGNGDSVYRFTRNQVRWYPNPTIANTWDSNWGSVISIDCTNIVLGQHMPQQ